MVGLNNLPLNITFVKKFVCTVCLKINKALIRCLNKSKFGMIHEIIFSYVYKDNNLYGYGY